MINYQDLNDLTQAAAEQTPVINYYTVLLQLSYGRFVLFQIHRRNFHILHLLHLLVQTTVFIVGCIRNRIRIHTFYFCTNAFNKLSLLQLDVIGASRRHMSCVVWRYIFGVGQRVCVCVFLFVIEEREVENGELKKERRRSK